MARDADLVTVPEAAREMFQANWERMVEASRVTEASFRQRPWRLFLENSWMTGWMFTDGKLDRNSLAGLVVAVVRNATTTMRTASADEAKDTRDLLA